jgi:hypothetical protein
LRVAPGLVWGGAPFCAPPVNGAPMPELLNDPDAWRQRAADVRRLSEGVADPKTKKTMLKIADDYEILAERAKARLGRPGANTVGSI